MKQTHPNPELLEMLDELAAVALAYRQNRTEGRPVRILSRALFDAASDVSKSTTCATLAVNQKP